MRALDLLQVAIYQRTNIGVQECCDGALVFAELRADLMRAADVYTKVRKHRGRRAFVLSIRIRMQKGDRDRLNPGGFYHTCEPLEFARCGAHRDGAIEVCSLMNTEAQLRIGEHPLRWRI